MWWESSPGGEEPSLCIGGRYTGVERPEEGKEGGELESRLTGILLLLSRDASRDTVSIELKKRKK